MSAQGFLRRADAAVLRIKSALVDRKTDEEFAAVEIVLRIGGEPQAGNHFVALLHQVAAFVNLGKKSANGNVVHDFDFGAGELGRGFIDPDEAVDSSKSSGGARSRFERGIWLHPVLDENAIRSHFAGNEGVQERRAGGVDEIVAFLHFFRDFVVGITLGTTVRCGPDQRAFELLHFRAVQRQVERFAVGSHGDAVDAGARRDGP